MIRAPSLGTYTILLMNRLGNMLMDVYTRVAVTFGELQETTDFGTSPRKITSLNNDGFNEETIKSYERQVNKVIERVQQQITREKQCKERMKNNIWRDREECEREF